MNRKRIIAVRYLLIFFTLFWVDQSFSQCSVVISTFPYVEDFEAGPGGWNAYGLSSDWVLGSPQKTTINSAGSGTQAWICGGLTGSTYNGGERAWVESPCFDFSNLLYPVVSLKIFWELENQFDGGNLQYSIDGGNNWQTIGNSSEPYNCISENWYTIRSITNLNSFAFPTAGWSGTIQATSGSCRGGNGAGEWKDAKHCVAQLAGKSSVIFRMTMGSGTTCNDYDGIAFDLFQIYEAGPIPFSISYTCLGGNQIQFNDSLRSCHKIWQWNFDDASSSDSISSLANPVHLFSTPGIHHVELTSSGDCIPSASASINLEVLDINVFSKQVTCDGGVDGQANVTVKNPPPGISFEWSTIPPITDSIATNLQTGTYLVTVAAPGFCDQQESVEIGYGPNAFPQVNLGNDTVLCPGVPIRLSAGQFATYEWQDGSTDSIFNAFTGGLVQVKIMNQFGCEASDTLIIEEDCLKDLLFPDSFSPNGDGLNEEFKGIGSKVSDYEMNIYNRWGQIVFNSVDPDLGWKGEKNNHAAEEGIYIFKVKYSVRTSAPVEKTGKVFLIR